VLRLSSPSAPAVASGCDPGGPSPYTVAVEAAGIAIAWSHDPSHVTTGPPPDRLAVTKALTAIDPDNAELVAARVRISLEPWQQWSQTRLRANARGDCRDAWKEHHLGPAPYNPRRRRSRSRGVRRRTCRRR
jgi:hypothetical protein